jgi:hypothetical protein
MSVRAAHPWESSAVFSVLTEIAPEIPLRLDTEERQRPVRELVDRACGGQMSWVSLDEGHAAAAPASSYMNSRRFS